jgi:Phage terminase large subunit (GpA)
MINEAVRIANPERLALETIAAALEPAAPIDYLAWAEENIVFDDGPFQGPYNPALFPYFNEILRALSPDDPCRFVTFIGSARVGKTTIGNIFALGAMTMGRGSFLYIHPTEDNARRWSRMKLSPLMRSTAIVREAFPQRARDTSDAVFYKERPPDRREPGAIPARFVPNFEDTNRPTIPKSSGASLSRPDYARATQNRLAFAAGGAPR